MSFLLMNLFSPATQATTLAAGSTPKADSSTGGNSGGGAAFSAMLANAKDRLAGSSAAAKSAAMLAPQSVDTTITAIKQPADALALLKDANLTQQQLSDLRDALRDMLDTESFAGEGGTEQAFQELHDSVEMELAEMGEGDIVDIEPVVMQLPVVTQAAQAPRGEMLVRIAQFLQASLSGQAAGHAKAEQASQAQIPHQSTRTDPLLEVVQASMFHAQALATAGTPQTGQQESTDTAELAPVQYQPGIVLAAYVPGQHAAQETQATDALPQWVRDISPAAKTAPQTDSGDIYQGMELPEISLPGDEAAAATPEQKQAALIAQAVQAAQAANAAPMNAATEVAVTPHAEQSAAVAAVAAPSKQVAAVNVDADVTSDVSTDGALVDKALPTAGQGTDEVSAAPREQAAATTKPTTKQVVTSNGAHIAAAAQAPVQAGEGLAPLPEKTGQDAVLEVTRTDGTTPGMAPTHSDKLAATHAQRAVNESLYHHRAEVVEQVHVAIARANKAEMDRITIQLDPADLGRVDVTMEIRRDGTTQLFVTADRRETLDMLQRDARSLERALQESGVKADAGSMEFNLRQQHGQAAFGGGDQNFHGGNAHAQASEGRSDSATAGESQHVIQPEIISSATYTVNGGLNVIV